MNLYEQLCAKSEQQKPDIQIELLFSENNRLELDSDEEKDLFDLLRSLYSLHMSEKGKDVQFEPFIVFNGKRSFSVEDLTEQDYQKLLAVDIARLPLSVRARLCDILWTEKSLYKYGEAAAVAYLEIYICLFSEDEYYKSLKYIRRSICIANQLNRNDLHDQACQCLYKSIFDSNEKGDCFFTLRAIEILLDQMYGDSSTLLLALDAIIQRNTDNINKVEQAYEIKVSFLNRTKKNEEARKANLELAEYYAAFANNTLNDHIQGAMRAAHILQKAVLLCRNNKAPERANELHRRLIEIQSEIPGQMTSITIQVDFGKYKSIIDANMEGLSFKESIIRLSQFISFQTQDDLKKKVIKSLHDYPFSTLFGKTIINSSGQPVLSLKPLDMNNPESDPLIEMHMHQQLLEEQKLLGDIWLQYMFSYIKGHYNFDQNDLSFLTKNNPIIPEGRERIIQLAIYKVLAGQFYEALHILAPQTENIFRVIAKEVGGLTLILENDGTSKEKVLSSLFDLPELLECYDNDILFTFRGLLNEQAGANIRNEVAHGLLDEISAGSGACLYFDAAVIKLLLLTSPEAYKIYKKSKRLKTVEKMELLESLTENDSEQGNNCDLK